MPLPSFAPSDDERVIAGVCAGIAQALAVDVTLVRLVFALLALAGGAGIVLYLALWVYGSSERPWWAALLVLFAGSLLLARRRPLGPRGASGSRSSPAGSRSPGGGAAASGRTRRSRTAACSLAGAGAVLLLEGGGATTTVLAPGAIAGALLLIAGPWLWRLALERDAERAARIRSDERSEVAARVHDSVLQTLALIQRHAQEPRRVASLARRQERELRGWLYGDRPLGDESASLVAALSAVAADVEEVHGVRVELASAGDCAGRRRARARRARGDDERREVRRRRGDRRLRRGDGRRASSVFVHDRGAGFDRAAVPPDRRGIAESIEGRLERAGGTRDDHDAPGEGTEVELRLPRSAT